MSDEQEELRARQLVAQLAGEDIPEACDEASTLAEFARALPWPKARPHPLFRARLRRELLYRPPARQRRPFWRLVPYALGGLLVGAVVVVGVLALAGPRIQGIFGLVYSSVDYAGYYGQPLSGRYSGSVEETRLPGAPAAQPTALVVQTQAVMISPAPPGATPTPVPLLPATALERKIIKNAEMQLLVEDTDVALDRITGIALEYGGYLISAHTWYDGGYKQATVVLAVPADSFEQAMRRLRSLATRVDRESSSGQDVTSQYVDLQAQLRNLQATEARLQDLLSRAQTVQEALNVNRELSNIEGQIEQIRGQMQYIEGRSAFSTISIDIYPPRPVPTPTPTPTPVAWQPGKTYEQAGTTLTAIGRFLLEAMIWIVVVVVPVVGIPVLVVLLIRWLTRRRGWGRGQPPPSGDSDNG